MVKSQLLEMGKITLVCDLPSSLETRYPLLLGYFKDLKKVQDMIWQRMVVVSVKLTIVLDNSQLEPNKA